MTTRKAGVRHYKPKPLMHYVKRTIKQVLPKKHRSTKRKVILN